MKTLPKYTAYNKKDLLAASSPYKSVPEDS